MTTFKKYKAEERIVDMRIQARTCNRRNRQKEPAGVPLALLQVRAVEETFWCRALPLQTLLASGGASGGGGANEDPIRHGCHWPICLVVRRAGSTFFLPSFLLGFSPI